MKSPKANCFFVGEQFCISSGRWEPAIYYKSFKTAVYLKSYVLIVLLYVEVGDRYQSLLFDLICLQVYINICFLLDLSFSWVSVSYYVIFFKRLNFHWREIENLEKDICSWNLKN